MHDEFVKSIAARVAEAERTGGNDPRKVHIVFATGNEHYAIPVSLVREVLRTPALTPVPTAPAYIQGIFSGRGRVIPAIDTAKRFHGGLDSPSLPAHLIVLERQGMYYGFLVDRVVDAVGVLPDAIHSISEDAPRHISQSYIRGQFSLMLSEKREGFRYDFFIAGPKTREVLAETPKEILKESHIFVLAIDDMIADLERDAKSM